MLPFQFWLEEDGQDLVEYALLMAFLSIAALAVLPAFAPVIQSFYRSMSNALVSASTASS